MTTRKSKILITGGAGFIGSQLGHCLSREGYDVVLVDDMSFGHLDNLVISGQTFGSFIGRDIRTKEIFPLFENVDCVFHFAGISALPVCQEQPYYALSVNVAGTVNVLEAARRAGVRRVIFSSTSAVYENNTDFPFREDDSVNPYLVYSTSKFQAEHICKAYIKTYGLEIVILRFFNVYGPHQDLKRLSPPLTGYIVRELLSGRQPVLHSDGMQERDYVYIDDINDLLTRSMTAENVSGEIFNACSNSTISVRKIYEYIADALKTNIEPIYRDAQHFWDRYPTLFDGHYPLNKEILVKEVNKYSLGSNEKAKKTLGWEPKVSPRDGLQEVVRYAQQII